MVSLSCAGASKNCCREVTYMMLQDFFSQHPKVALAFSGGTDSAYLLYTALQCGADVRPYYVKSEFQPQFELDDALRLTQQLGVALTVLRLDILADKTICANPQDRCYYCKTRIFSHIAAAAAADGYSAVIDGTNASDHADDRPGMRALAELRVYSPLRLCGLTKPEIRRLSKEAGLFTWAKPAYACLATRIPAGTALDVETLTAVEQTECRLMELGFHNIRARVRDEMILLEVLPEQFSLAEAHWAEITTCIQECFPMARVALKVRKNVT